MLFGTHRGRGDYWEAALRKQKLILSPLFANTKFFFLGLLQIQNHRLNQGIQPTQIKEQQLFANPQKPWWSWRERWWRLLRGSALQTKIYFSTVLRQKKFSQKFPVTAALNTKTFCQAWERKTISEEPPRIRKYKFISSMFFGTRRDRGNSRRDRGNYWEAALCKYKFISQLFANPQKPWWS